MVLCGKFGENNTDIMEMLTLGNIRTMMYEQSNLVQDKYEFQIQNQICLPKICPSLYPKVMGDTNPK